MTRKLLTRAEVLERAQSRRAEKAQQAKTKPKAKHKTKGGRNSNPKKLAWLRTFSCLVSNRAHGMECDGRTEVHHHRLRGARATDTRTVPLCAGHHRTGPASVEKLGRVGFESRYNLNLDAECAWYDSQFAARSSSPGSPEQDGV